MEPEGSLSCSQEPATGPYLVHASLTIYVRSILILSSHLHLGLPSGFFPSGFPTKILHDFSSLPCVLYPPPLSSSLTWSPSQYLVKSTSYEAPHYAVFPHPPATSSHLGRNM
jgi:hypothetical protein